MTAQQLQELFLSQQPYLELVRLLESRGTVIGLALRMHSWRQERSGNGEAFMFSSWRIGMGPVIFTTT